LTEGIKNAQRGSDLDLEQLRRDVPSVYIDVQGGAGYVFTCPKGHSSAFCLNMPQHALLFNAGCAHFAHRDHLFRIMIGAKRRWSGLLFGCWLFSPRGAL
jgi:hypothetical protein